MLLPPPARFAAGQPVEDVVSSEGTVTEPGPVVVAQLSYPLPAAPPRWDDVPRRVDLAESSPPSPEDGPLLVSALPASPDEIADLAQERRSNADGRDVADQDVADQDVVGPDVAAGCSSVDGQVDFDLFDSADEIGACAALPPVDLTVDVALPSRPDPDDRLDTFCERGATGADPSGSCASPSLSLAGDMDAGQDHGGL